MKNLFYVLKFELLNYFQSKGYVLTTALVAILLFIGLSLPAFIDFSFLTESSNENTYEWGIYDEGNVFNDQISPEQIFPSSTITLHLASSLDELKELVENATVSAGFQLNSATEYTHYVMNTSLTDSQRQVFESMFSVLNQQITFAQAGLDYTEISSIVNTPIVSSTEILGTDGRGNYFYAYMLLFIIYFIIMFYGQMIATAVASEKSNRAIEVLVTSTNTNNLIFGKVIAGALAGIIQVTVMLGSGIISYSIHRESWGNILDMIFNIPTNVLVAFATFGIFGYLLYSFLYAALGALVSKTEEIGKTTGIVMFVVMIGFFIAMYGLTSPESALVKISSFIPFLSPYMMLLRVAMGGVMAWELIVSFIILVVTIILVGLLGSKIYRLGTLMIGNPIKLSTALKLLKQDRAEEKS